MNIICADGVFLLGKKEITEYLKDDGKTDELFKLADETRKKYVGDCVHLRGLIEFSNICKCNCHYCGLRCGNKNVQRYRLSEREILLCAQKAVEAGYKTVVLQSGEDAFYSRDVLCRIIEEIKKLGVALTLSVGERSFEDFKAFKEAGADRYLLRIETTDKTLYSKLHPNMSFENRKNCLRWIKELGYETGTGCLVGLPGQTVESLADDILFFKEAGADMVGIGPLIPHPETPLKDAPQGSLNLALKVMALTRIILKDVNIPATTAMETLNPQGRIMALQCGANVVMPNVTFLDYRKNYEIYPNKVGVNEDPSSGRSCVEAKIKSIGRTVSADAGFRKSSHSGNC